MNFVQTIYEDHFSISDHRAICSKSGAKSVKAMSRLFRGFRLTQRGLSDDKFAADLHAA
jgi:hypothetical protein